jgi:hypothetical protein
MRRNAGINLPLLSRAFVGAEADNFSNIASSITRRVLKV